MKKPDRSRWSDWHQLTSSDLPIENRPGVYVIASDSALNRLVGIDHNGILTIGESNRLKARVKHFIGCAIGKPEFGHSAGWRYRNLNFARQFPLNSLYVRWMYIRKGEDEYELEGLLLQEYVKRHFELPPLNYKFNFGGPKARRG
ncbi:MAG TPA: hypothetical protein VFT46_10655 [Holophagaceae bacterium]|nr:hypothetical protein [Holophagaceae bacterium]